MKHLCLALALALIALPVTALADDNPPAPASQPGLTPAQRQAMFKTMQTFRDKERQMHQQMRAQILGALSPEHRTAVAGVIGEMVISDNPDPVAAAKQIDSVLSLGEQRAILTAHTSFVTQSQALMQQMHAQLQSQLPAGTQPHPHWATEMHHPPSAIANDAGSVLMMVLAHRAPLGMEMGDHQPGMPGGPPGGVPPGSAPPPGDPPPPGNPPPAL
jgi:hypothetical protein